MVPVGPAALLARIRGGARAAGAAGAVPLRLLLPGREDRGHALGRVRGPRPLLARAQEAFIGPRLAGI